MIKKLDVKRLKSVKGGNKHKVFSTLGYYGLGGASTGMGLCGPGCAIIGTGIGIAVGGAHIGFGQ